MVVATPIFFLLFFAHPFCVPDARFASCCLLPFPGPVPSDFTGILALATHLLPPDAPPSFTAIQQVAISNLHTASRRHVMMEWVSAAHAAASDGTPLLRSPAAKHAPVSSAFEASPTPSAPATGALAHPLATKPTATVHGVVPIFGRADSGDTNSSAGNSPRPGDDDLDQHAVPQFCLLPSAATAHHLRMQERVASPGIASANPTTTSTAVMRSPSAAAAAVNGIVNRRRRCFAAPPLRAPALPAARTEAGLAFTLPAASTPGRVIKRNFRRRRAAAARRRRRQQNDRAAAAAAAAALAAANGTTSSTLASSSSSSSTSPKHDAAGKQVRGGKRLRDRSSLRKPLRAAEADESEAGMSAHFSAHGAASSEHEHDHDHMHLDADSADALDAAVDALVAQTAAAVAAADALARPKAAKKTASGASPSQPRASPTSYPPQYISAGPGKPRKQKQCACCATTSTPLWRDIGRKLPLCNACGIRYKKYGLICSSCNYVPCKQERTSKVCRRCTTKLPPASAKARMPAEIAAAGALAAAGGSAGAGGGSAPPVAFNSPMA